MQAAQELGISDAAVRQRIKRGQLRSEKIDGRVYVLFDQAPPNGHTGDQTAFQARSNSDATGDQTFDETVFDQRPPPGYQQLITNLEGEVAFLREQIQTKDEQLRANQIIISQLAERAKALSAPQAQETTNRPPQTTDLPQPWWKRLFSLQ